MKDYSDQRANASFNTTINLNEFQLLLQDYELMDTSLSRVKALSSFVMSQEDSEAHDPERSYDMCYTEYLECLGRLADARYSNATNEIGEGLELSEKLQKLMEFIFDTDILEKRKRQAAAALAASNEKTGTTNGKNGNGTGTGTGAGTLTSVAEEKENPTPVPDKKLHKSLKTPKDSVRPLPLPSSPDKPSTSKSTTSKNVRIASNAKK